jgi:hypothetical protein
MIEKKIETKTPSQSISTLFGHHDRAIQGHLFREETRGRTYSKYEALQLVLETLHPLYHLDLKFRAEKEFDQSHHFEESIQFKLQMSQLGTTLTSWSSEMRLLKKKAHHVLHISQNASNDEESLRDPGIFSLSKDLKFYLCAHSIHENTS